MNLSQTATYLYFFVSVSIVVAMLRSGLQEENSHEDLLNANKMIP